MSDDRDRPEPTEANPFDAARFTMNAPCLPCCIQPAPPSCKCEFKFPIYDTVTTPGGLYIDATDAQAALTAYASCYAFGIESLAFTDPTLWVPLGSLASTWAHATPKLTVAGTTAGANTFLYLGGSISVLENTEITFTVALGGDAAGYTVGLWRCDETVYATPAILTCSGFGSGSCSINVGSSADFPTGFQWVIEVYPATGTGVLSASVEITADMVFVANPVNAYYDSGDPVNPWLLEACPRLLLPQLTEASGSWYETLEDAEAAFAFNDGNCWAYFEIGPTVSRTATPGTDELIITEDFGTPTANSGLIWFSISMGAGDSFTITGSRAGLFVEVYSYKGLVIESSVPTNPFTSAAAPYTGKYIVLFGMFSNPGDPTPDNFTATIEGPFTTNPIQALYDVGLPTCPGRLDCP